MVRMAVGAGSLPSLVRNVLVKSSQSMRLKSCRGAASTSGAEISNTVSMGKWSVLVGRFSGRAVHFITVFRSASDRNTLSTLVKFPDDIALRVGIPSGSAIFM